jgi:hypothetical protein
MAVSGPAHPNQENTMFRNSFIHDLPRNGFSAVSLAAVCLLGSSCASHVPLRSGSASSYARLPADPSRKGVLQAPLDPGCIGGYKQLRFEPVTYAEGVRDKLHAKTMSVVETALVDGTRSGMARHFIQTDNEASGTLRLRLVVTRITESSPIGNVISTAALTPIFNGALAVEAELLDATTGKQCGLYLWADEGSIMNFKEFTGNFRRAGHPQKLAGYFGDSLAAYAAPLRTSVGVMPPLPQSETPIRESTP